MSETQETFLSHLIELRSRLVRCLIAVAIAAIPTLYFSAELYDILAQPVIHALPSGSKMIATGVITPFLIPMKIGMMAALLVVLPYVLYEVWAFVAPGLYAHEKRLMLPLVVSSTILFFAGMAFCYFFVFGAVFDFILKFSPKSISVAPDIEAYFNFVLGMFLAFGIAFEIPVVVVVLVATGIVTTDQLREFRGYVIVGIFVVAAVVTPPDVVSQLALAIPMCLLYEIGIIFAQLVEKRRKEEAPGGAP
ncbi:twin-arginine translocase subunit TatC [Usitatibacter palustris]|uniref:Sec-independent protein translocase protein TatC n=1 Tax=Usitatibacter palustris TaxID=2732487 RepID=A0A6M4HEF5_9PROT|nr:twin-arginine translocase subunit TatC [Usitatibacter palustris]QJR16367.1 Sec-independent protein translocase protein TatC [Usitatibacter palustris]